MDIESFGRILVCILFSFFQITVESKCFKNCSFCSNEEIICTAIGLIDVPMVSPFMIHFNISHNEIQDLEQKSFAHLPLLIDLDLSHNVVSIIPDRVFAGLGSLKRL
ncbi:hypothetical protein SSS_10850 [Sarcoptes scabiei]|nr:hypothetical protein SSS_10850 [Sarcoptes scabiei]